jgi:hypothetical protein
MKHDEGIVYCGGGGRANGIPGGGGRANGGIPMGGIPGGGMPGGGMPRPIIGGIPGGGIPRPMPGGGIPPNHEAPIYIIQELKQ